MIMTALYTEEDKQRIRVANESVITDLKKAIIEGKVKEYFDSFGFRPRYLELIDIAFCYQDGIQIVLDLYDYIKQNIRDIHVPAMINKLVPFSCFHSLITSNYEELLNRTIKASNLFTNSSLSFAKDIMTIPNGDKLILPRINDIMDNVNPTLVWETVTLFKDKEYFYQLLKDNFEYWVSISRGVSVINLVETMLKIDQQNTIEYIKRDFETILINIGGGQILKILSEFSNYSELIVVMKEKKEAIISLCNNYDISNVTESLDENIGLGILEENPLIKLLREKMPKEKHSHGAMGAIIRSRRSEYIKTIIEQLMEQEKQTDFTSIGDNSWSNIVFKIGTKVLKLGWVRNNPDCPEHYRILSPDKFEVICNKYGDPVLYIEVQQYLSQEYITKEDVDSFYVDIDKDGYTYIDPKGNNPTNFGLLSNEEALTIQSNENVSESFKRKALVLIDRDCIWRKGDPNIKYMGGDY